MDEEEILTEEETSAPNDAVILNYSQNPVTYKAVPKVWLTHPDSTEEAPVLVPFTYGELVEGTEIVPDFSAGDQEISVPDGYLVKEATIKKPENLLPENIRYGKEIAGVEGEFLGDAEEVSVGSVEDGDTYELDLSGGDMTVEASEGKTMSKVTIKKPETLIPANIAKDVVVAGIKGTHEGGGGGESGDDSTERDMSTKPIRFYDPYGNVIYAYTRAEAQELTELPPGPTLSGLTFERWTHTLAEIQGTTYFADVGPQYKYGSSPATVLIIETLIASQTVSFAINAAISGSLTFYWGDGTYTAAATGTGRKSVSKTFSTAGEHIIAVVCTSGSYSLGYQNGSLNYSVVSKAYAYGSISSASYVAPSAVESCLKSVLIGTYISSTSSPIGINWILGGLRIKFISAYEPDTSKILYRGISQNPALQVLTGNTPFKLGNNYPFYGNCSLKRISVSGIVPETAFSQCDSLEEVIYGSNTINEPHMNSQWAMLMTTETPPTIGATSPVWGTKPIYVPDAAVDTYKAADGWSSAADYIVPVSQYPD